MDQLPHSWPPDYPRHRPISAAEARSLDRRAEEEFGIPSFALMEHASMGVAHLAAAMAGPEDSILVLCGPGNNGGDGYGAARFLASWGRAVEVVTCAGRPPTTGDAGLEFRLSGDAGSAIGSPELVQICLDRSPAVVVDALFGVGMTRLLEPPFLDWIEAMNTASALRLCVDVPSGLEADSGEPLPTCVLADVTATMAAPKTGLLATPEAAGHVVEIDIGLPRALHEAFLA